MSYYSTGVYWLQWLPKEITTLRLIVLLGIAVLLQCHSATYDMHVDRVSNVGFTVFCSKTRFAILMVDVTYYSLRWIPLYSCNGYGTNPSSFNDTCKGLATTRGWSWVSPVLCSAPSTIKLNFLQSGVKHHFNNRIPFIVVDYNGFRT